MWINLGVGEIDMLTATPKMEVKDAIFELLQNELGLEVVVAAPRPPVHQEMNLDLENAADSDPNWTKSSIEDSKMVSSPRRPVGLHRLKVTRNSLHCWLQRRLTSTK